MIVRLIGRTLMLAIITLIGYWLITTANPRAATPTPDVPPNKGVQLGGLDGVFYETCAPARNAVTYYRRAYTWQRKAMNLTGAVPFVRYACEPTRRRAVEWRDKFRDARQARLDWVRDQHDWTRWLPDKWQRIGACETGYGRRPGNWQHNSGSYQGAFGFANQSWDSFVPRADQAWGPYPSEAYLATPRQQYEVALAIYRRYGLSGWGCRGA